jgi:hypothetical protein
MLPTKSFSAKTSAVIASNDPRIADDTLQRIRKQQMRATQMITPSLARASPYV